jgi:phospholipid/cholesterol/gamma-HCH transport system permease protein
MDIKLLFFIKTFRTLITTKPNVKNILTETYKIGWESLPIVIFVGLFIGTNLALQGYYAFKSFGGQDLVGLFVALAGLREMAPIVAGSMVGAKSGSEIASVLANMRISKQIDALEIMAIDPIWYLVTPKLIAIIFVLPLLSIISSFCVCASGYFVSIYQLDISPSTFITHASEFIFFRDFLIGAFKGFSFGIIICLICTFFGYTSKPGPEGVGNATNKAVVFSSLSYIIANYFLTEIFY